MSSPYAKARTFAMSRLFHLLEDNGQMAIVKERRVSFAESMNSKGESCLRLMSHTDDPGRVSGEQETRSVPLSSYVLSVLNQSMRTRKSRH